MCTPHIQKLNIGRWIRGFELALSPLRIRVYRTREHRFFCCSFRLGSFQSRAHVLCVTDLDDATYSVLLSTTGTEHYVTRTRQAGYPAGHSMRLQSASRSSALVMTAPAGILVPSGIRRVVLRSLLPARDPLLSLLPRSRRRPPPPRGRRRRRPPR